MEPMRMMEKLILCDMIYHHRVLFDARAVGLIILAAAQVRLVGAVRSILFISVISLTISTFNVVSIVI